ncbi:hypothetical protein ACPV4W_22680, partial [Vibrio diabolicus]|uniref:hypothetical protein n=1 Tax=Vibrio diabolicus TaxID=50719 RepID=UPI004067A074
PCVAFSVEGGMRKHRHCVAHTLTGRYVFGGLMGEYKKLFECARPDFISHLTAVREEEQGILKLSLQTGSQCVDLFGFDELADSASDLLSAERIIISEELDTYKEFGTIRIECWVDDCYSEYWCDRANIEQT